MPRKAWIDKKTATHFHVVHRPQNDPLIHDEAASSTVLAPSTLPVTHKIKKLNDLASELGSNISTFRSNEGEAAEYGVYYDDTEYDYMQHMRDLGQGSGDATWIEPRSTDKGKWREKESLDEALQGLKLGDGVNFDESILPSKNLRATTYQAQQDIPDALAGFQPDMDPRLREVLEALEDEAYVDDDEDIFGELAADGEELDESEFDQGEWEEDEDAGWESDATAKPEKADPEDDDEVPDLVRTDEAVDHVNGEFMANFSKYKKEQESQASRAPPTASGLQSSIMTTTTNGGRRKKRKGALTSQSGYSMTSSSLFRTEGLTDLDARFDRVDALYGADINDDVSVSAASSVASQSSVTGPMRSDFDSIMDDFLGNYSMNGKKHVKKGRYQTGMEQLDEIRRELGPARIRQQKA